MGIMRGPRRHYSTLEIKKALLEEKVGKKKETGFVVIVPGPGIYFLSLTTET